MVGSSGDVNQGTTVGGENGPIGVRASVVAKKRVMIVERREVGMWCLSTRDRQLKRAGRVPQGYYLLAQRTPLLGGGVWADSGPPGFQVSGTQVCAAGATLPDALSRVPKPVHREPQTGKPYVRKSASTVWEGGGA